MKIEVRVDATTNERRRLIGQADITPIVELVSETLDMAMMAVVDRRLAALTAELDGQSERDGR